MKQEEFWARIGVTQSRGSRYEGDHRGMPRPVRELLRVVHVERVDLSQLEQMDFEIIDYLKTARPDLYQNLRRASKNRGRGSGGGGVPD
jgi:uncharacterized protein YgfB (UPF0149 family)